MHSLLTTRVPGPLSPTSWRDRWQAQKQALLATPGYGSPDQYWNTERNVTDLYAKSRKKQSWQEKSAAQREAMTIPDGARVLDIGGGTGTLAIPLAARGCEVTVVEPSRVMREELAKNIRDAGLESVIVLPCRWEDCNPDDLGDPFETVIASYSLAMPDIGTAIGKMQACSRGTVSLFWFLTPPFWSRVSSDLWPFLHGAAYPGEPLADCLWQVLHEMGIMARLTIEKKKPSRYLSVDELVRDTFQRLNCTTPGQEEILRNYFSMILRQDGDGFVYPYDSYSAHLQWSTGHTA